MEFKIENLLPYSKLKNKKSAKYYISDTAGYIDIHGIGKDNYNALRKVGVVTGVSCGTVSVREEAHDCTWMVPTVCFKGVRK